MMPTYDDTPREDARAERLLGTIERRAFDAGAIAMQHLAADMLVRSMLERRRHDFDHGALAMQQRIIDGIRRWWSAAPAGHRHPGHPHHLEVKVREVKVEELEGRP